MKKNPKSSIYKGRVLLCISVIMLGMMAIFWGLCLEYLQYHSTEDCLYWYMVGAVCITSGIITWITGAIKEKKPMITKKGKVVEKNKLNFWVIEFEDGERAFCNTEPGIILMLNDEGTFEYKNNRVFRFTKERKQAEVPKQGGSFCPTCGNRIEKGMLYCSNCGRKNDQ